MIHGVLCSYIKAIFSHQTMYRLKTKTFLQVALRVTANNTYIHVHIRTYTYIHVHTPTPTYLHVYTRTYTYIHEYTRAYIHVHICSYTYIRVHTRAYMHVHARTYAYIHVHTCKSCGPLWHKSICFSDQAPCTNTEYFYLIKENSYYQFWYNLIETKNLRKTNTLHYIWSSRFQYRWLSQFQCSRVDSTKKTFIKIWDKTDEISWLTVTCLPHLL